MAEILPCFYRVSTKALIFDAEGRMLLGKEEDNVWEHLGGGLDFGEDQIDGLRREIYEETGLEVASVNPKVVAAISVLDDKSKHNGGEVWKMLLLYTTVLVSDDAVADLVPSSECIEIAYFTPEEIVGRDDVSAPAKAIATYIIEKENSS